MFKKMSLRVRFAVMLIIIFFVSIPVVGAVAYFVLEKNISEDVFQQAKFFLNTMESVRKHVGKVSRPAAQEHLPKIFDVKLMSTSYAARGVAERLKENFPEYTFRHISVNPRNSLNRADNFEQSLIQYFGVNRQIQEVKGFIDKGPSEYFYVAKAVISDDSCMGCHGTPEAAPKEVIATYGGAAAFGWQPNQVVAALIVYVPTRLARTHAFEALLTFMGMYGAVFFVILIMIDRAIVRGIIRPIRAFATTADEISMGNFEKEFSVSSNDEMKTLAEAFRRMKMSIIASMNMIEKYRKGTGGPAPK